MDTGISKVLGGASLITETRTVSGTFTCPPGVTALETLLGYGAAGTPAQSYIAPTYATTTVRAAGVDFFLGSTGGAAGNFTWAGLNGYVIAARDAFNAGSDTAGGVTVVQRYNSGDYSYSYSGFTINPGVDVQSATTVIYSANWAYSGDIFQGSNFSAYADITVQYYTSYGQPAADATTGASATMTHAGSGFSKTFPGGVGGGAAITNFGPTTVVPGNAYALTIPSGATIQISYYA